MTALPLQVVVGMFLGVLALPAMAQADREKKPAPKEQEEFPRWTVSGTFYTDMSAVEADKHERDPIPEEGITGEYSLGATYHADKSFTVTVRACVGCHSFELQSAYFDWNVDPTWTVRAGRIPVPFGGFSRRTNPSHVESGTKPLPYIMGGMVRQEQFNMGIVPAPFIDNGAAVTGTFWVSRSATLSVETALVRGLKGFSPDLDFEASRDFEDSNGEPAVAARVLLTADPFTTGASVTWGRYDANAELEYFMASVELQVRFGQWSLRLEGVMRDTEYFTPDAFSAARDLETSRRQAYVVQLDGPVTDSWRVFVLHDYMRVEDVFLGPAGPSAVESPLTTDNSNATARVATGFVYSARAGLQVKASIEYWDPTDFETAIVFHLGVVAEY
ncbi:MAG TPA: hypothetical protein VFC90_08925 [Planctomycetota bacterium]|nr:hypothetical protein [Planctomycetota bacterium]